jgi:sodium-coupled monocarboxylate transporter 8/12
MIPGVAGLFLGALFCASLSSVSSSLNSQSSIIWTDFLCIFAYFKQFDDTQSLRTNKLIVLICGLVSTALSFAVSVIGGNLIQISSILNGAFVAPLTGLFVLGLFFSISNSVGAIAGTVCGFIASCWISFGVFIVKPTFPKLSTSIEGCSGYETTNMTTLTSFQFYSSTETPELNLGFNKFYYLSYMWYTTFGTLVTVVFGLLFSLVTKKWDKHNNQAFVLLDFFGFIKIFKSFSKKLSNK